MSYADDWSEEQLQKAEKAIKQIYQKAWLELQGKADDYFSKLEVRDNEMKARLDAGEITEDYYRQWRRNQILRGNRWKALIKQAADRMGNANEVAAAYVNDRTPGIYSLNHNYECYLMEGDAAERNHSVSLTVYNEQAVKRLTSGKQQRITPKYKYRTCQPDGTAWSEWNQQELQKCVASAIIRGATLKDMVGEFKRVCGMDQAAAIRNARTSWTSAQQAGRYEAQQEAADMGLDYKRKWICVKDDRTRSSHQKMDWQIREMDEPFTTPGGAKLMYPGDPSGPAGEVYNCRCTVCTVDPLEEELPVPKKIRVRDADGNNVVVEDMKYSDWLKWKEEQQEEIEETPQKNGKPGAAKYAKSASAGKQKVSKSREKAESEKLNSGLPETLAGVKRGKPMTFEEADNYKTNPKYGYGNGYSNNCQTSIVAFDARCKGYDVIAGARVKGGFGDLLANEPNKAWKRLDNDENPSYIYDNNVTTEEELYNFVDKTINQGERYVLEYIWKKDSDNEYEDGHVLIIDKDENNNIRLHDSQVSSDFKSIWLGRKEVISAFKSMQIKGKTKKTAYTFDGQRYVIKSYNGAKIFRIDNCTFDDRANEILEEA